MSSATAGVIDWRSKRLHHRTSVSSCRRLGASSARLMPVPHVSDLALLLSEVDYRLRDAPGIVLGRSGPPVRPVHDERRNALGIARGEYPGHVRALRPAEQVRSLAADRIHDDSDVVDSLLDRRGSIERIGQPRSTLVEDDHPGEGRQPSHEPLIRRVLPGDFEIRDESGHQHQVTRPLAHDLIGDPNVARTRVQSLGLHACSTLTPLPLPPVCRRIAQIPNFRLASPRRWRKDGPGLAGEARQESERHEDEASDPRSRSGGTHRTRRTEQRPGCQQLHDLRRL